jgi:hypothetical protein
MTRITIIVFFILFFCGCEKTFLGDDPVSTPRENFEYLWKTVDEKYSFFAYKKINWDSVYQVYAPKVHNNLSDVQLFDIMFKMLGELHDAHVNLISPFNTSRYENVFSQSPVNFDSKLLAAYLGNDYYITGPFSHQFLSNSEIGYIRYNSFSDDVSESDIDFILSRFKDTKGIVFDIRSNGGGYISNLFKICSRFADQNRLVFYSYLKNGIGHEDFSGPNGIYVNPSSNHYTGKVCVLTNRGTYSAASFFVLAMREFQNVTVVGDSTGGGLGTPIGVELPNGWAFRFSASRTISPLGENFEDGIPPDIKVNLLASDAEKNKDSIIEKAISIIKEGD